MSRFRTALYILGILFGIFIFVFGGYDDSPGAQGLGAVIFVGCVTGLIRGRKKTSV